MYGFWRLEGLTSSSLIFSIWRGARGRLARLRLVGGKAADELLQVGDLRSFVFALSASSCSRACVEAIM